jgi:hypothetical protein
MNRKTVKAQDKGRVVTQRCNKVATDLICLPAKRDDSEDMNRAPRFRRTPQQVKAAHAYQFACQQEERYLGSVFVTVQGQRDAEAKTAAAYAEVARLQAAAFAHDAKVSS